MGLATYLDGVVTMDDGKANVLSLAMQADLHAALDAAEADDAPAIVLRGREGRFCAGFDLATLGAGGPDAAAMLGGGFELAHRLLTFPRPVVVACTGHAVAMGVFLLLSGDHRVGLDGPFTIQANEVAIGLTMPRAAIEICRLRLAPTHLHRAVVLAERYDPSGAVAAGFLDEVVATDVDAAARAVAERLAALDVRAFRGTRKRLHAERMAALRAAMEQDGEELAALLR